MLVRISFKNAVESGSLPPEIESTLDDIISAYLEDVAKEYPSIFLVSDDISQHELILDLPMQEASYRIDNMQYIVEKINEKFIKGASPSCAIRPTAIVSVQIPTGIFSDGIVCAAKLSSAPVYKNRQWAEILNLQSAEQDTLCLDRQ
jgi:hypothetical protein